MISLLLQWDNMMSCVRCLNTSSGMGGEMFWEGVSGRSVIIFQA